MVYTTHTFVKKLTAENFGRKSLLLTMEQFFPKFEIMQWNGAITRKWKKVFKISICLASVKTGYVCFLFLSHYFKYYVQNTFARTTVPYLIAKVERK